MLVHTYRVDLGGVGFGRHLGHRGPAALVAADGGDDGLAGGGAGLGRLQTSSALWSQTLELHCDRRATRSQNAGLGRGARDGEDEEEEGTQNLGGRHGGWFSAN